MNVVTGSFRKPYDAYPHWPVNRFQTKRPNPPRNASAACHGTPQLHTDPVAQTQLGAIGHGFWFRATDGSTVPNRYRMARIATAWNGRISTRIRMYRPNGPSRPVGCPSSSRRRVTPYAPATASAAEIAAIDRTASSIRTSEGTANTGGRSMVRFVSPVGGT